MRLHMSDMPLSLYKQMLLHDIEDYREIQSIFFQELMKTQLRMFRPQKMQELRLKSLFGKTPRRLRTCFQSLIYQLTSLLAQQKRDIKKELRLFGRQQIQSTYIKRYIRVCTVLDVSYFIKRRN